MTIDNKALKAQGILPQWQRGRYSIRLKVVGGRLTTNQLKAIVSAADQFGDGHIHLTSRQAVEIPNVKYENLESLKATLAAGDAQSCLLGPKVRTVTACQGLETCKWGCLETQPLAAELTDRYYGRPLPAKFKLGVTGCRNNCMKVEENDLGVKGGMLVEWSKAPCRLCGECVEGCRFGALTLLEDGVKIDKSKCLNCGRCVKTCPTGAWMGKPAYNVYFGGNFGNGSHTARQLVPLIDNRETLFKALDAAVEFFAANGKPGQRFRTVVENAGWDNLAQSVAQATAV